MASRFSSALLLVFSSVFAIVSSQQELLGKVEENFYEKTCPAAERIVRDVVTSHFGRNRTVPAGLLRLFFHDCFVQGCDGSILLDASEDGSVIEKEGLPNRNSVRGFDVIDDAKTRLERVCPGVVSCADIVALAGRDAVVLVGAPDFAMPTGRLDGRISRRSEADALLPAPFFNATQLKASFAQQNLTVEDLVHLSGGHTIGRSQCQFFSNRLYNFSGGSPDPLLNPSYRAELQRLCPQNSRPTDRVTLDRASEFNFDNSYYTNLVAKNGLLTSDAVLTVDSETESIVRSFARDPDRFQLRFQKSLLKMSKLGLKSKANGEVRRRCNAINPKRMEEESSLVTAITDAITRALAFSK
ncbi:hypothetical protein SELMODRAFT_272010 [Selaginella moellendorffii]|uniref:Peroxidase n=1 Tax=Selaginella moellendorffii TaxID=88036 RepID=D8SYY2_SELML|nr:cationic peroxidase 2 [Selaginella moellendorffii]EFJ10390.1 hypothetical protein SELMODRAFT_272010 [Selaginella moellendorffii]|eukprot:XP_024518077.1 cationic peroxidase 2 [Selaginella moellendorffii]